MSIKHKFISKTPINCHPVKQIIIFLYIKKKNELKDVYNFFFFLNIRLYLKTFMYQLKF